MIATLTDVEKDLTIHKVSGDIEDVDLASVLSILSKTLTRDVIWDLREFYYLAGIAPHIVDDITGHLKQIPIEAGGRTAFVFSSQSDLEIGKMYESHTCKGELDFDVALFQSLQEALGWLD